MEKRQPELKDFGYTHTYIVGISGISSSGKTTLARHLRRLFTNLTIPASQSAVSSDGVGEISFNVSLLHQDDFYVPPSALPVRSITIKRQGSKPEETEETVDMVDWDCPGAINFATFQTALGLLRQGIPYAEVLHSLGIVGLEPPADTAPGGAMEEALTTVRRAIISRLYTVGEKVPKRFRKDLRINLILVEGFMLYHRDDDEDKQTGPPVMSLLDLKLLLRIPYAVAKERREARNGYNTTDGHWTDPEGYFDGLVWPSYVRCHRHIFVEGDVEAGILTKEWGSEGKGIELHSGDEGVERLLQWASGKVADIIVRGMGYN